MEQRKLPVQVGEEVTVTISSIGAKGDGIARKDGYVIVVSEAKEGRRYKIKVTKTLDKVGFGTIVEEVEMPPEEKIVPPPAKEDQKVDEASEEFGED